jgi:hypothetical protein
MTGSEPESRVVRVPLSPEMRHLMDVAAEKEREYRQTLERLLTPEALARFDDAEREAVLRFVEGE